MVVTKIWKKRKKKNSQTPTLEVTTAIVENNVLGAQAHFSTTQQLFLSSSEPKKTTCGISKYIFFIVKYIFTASVLIFQHSLSLSST